MAVCAAGLGSKRQVKIHVGSLLQVPVFIHLWPARTQAQKIFLLVMFCNVHFIVPSIPRQLRWSGAGAAHADRKSPLAPVGEMLTAQKMVYTVLLSWVWSEQNSARGCSWSSGPSEFGCSTISCFALCHGHVGSRQGSPESPGCFGRQCSFLTMPLYNV